MKKKITYRKINVLENVSIKRCVLAIVAGLLFSFVFYALLFTLRETFRILFSIFVDSNPFLELKSNEISFYNFIFAVLSSILGLSLTLKIIFEKPKQFGVNNHYYYRKSLVFNSISFINISTISFLFRLIPFPLFVFGTTFSYYLSFYDEYKFLMYLIVIVLFLEQWKTIRLIFKNRALKWMAISLISILSYSFAISKINVIDFKKINTYYLSKRLDHNYELELPEINNYKKNERRSLVQTFTIAYSKNNVNHNRFPYIIFETVAYRLESMPAVLASIRENYSEYEIPMVTIQLNIDKHIKMKYINQIKDTIANSGFSKIGYGITSKNTKLPKELQLGLVSLELLPFRQNNKEELPIPKFDKASIPKEHLFVIKKIKNNIYINGNMDSINKTSLKEFILKSPQKNIFVIELVKTNTLNDYLAIKDQLISAYKDIRDEHSIKGYGVTLDELSYNYKRAIKRKFPQLIVVTE